MIDCRGALSCISDAQQSNYYVHSYSQVELRLVSRIVNEHWTPIQVVNLGESLTMRVSSRVDVGPGARSVWATVSEIRRPCPSHVTGDSRCMGSLSLILEFEPGRRPSSILPLKQRILLVAFDSDDTNQTLRIDSEYNFV